jgi:predicted ATPase
MRLKRIYLPNFKNLRDFNIDFAPDSPTTVLVGRNATGKSNLIEAIVTIFRDLDAGPDQIRLTPFPYKFEYSIHGRTVRIEHDPELKRNRTKIFVADEPFPVRNVVGHGADEILPDTVFAYYSGPSNRLETVFDAPLATFRDAMIKRRQDVRQRMLYGRPIHSKFVLLSFLAESDVAQFEFLSRELGIVGVESVLFVLRQPYWASGRQGAENKANFWGAAGVVRSFLEEVYKAALAPLLLEQRVPLGIKQRKTLEHLYLYLKDQDSLVRLVDNLASKQAIFSRSRELFTILESAFVSDLISDIRVNLRKRNVDGTVTFTELSEGEQQLLLVLGLLRFTKEEESLFLLDEPDTHLNPAWSLRFLKLIDEAVGHHDQSHLLIASHDPVAISLLRKREVRHLEADDRSGRISSYEPIEHPIDLGVSGVLLSELFGFQSAYAPERADELADRDRLREKVDRTEAESERLASLERSLAEVDLASVHPDRLYVLFMREMLAQQRAEIANKPALTRAEVLEQRELTAEIVRAIRADEVRD